MVRLEDWLHGETGTGAATGNNWSSLQASSLRHFEQRKRAPRP